jgi:hypothetical protein
MNGVQATLNLYTFSKLMKRVRIVFKHNNDADKEGNVSSDNEG